MSGNLKEAVPIGRLLGIDRETMGWVYRWNTAEMSVLWLAEASDPTSIEFSPLPGSNNANNEAVEDLLRDFRADGDMC